MELIFKEKFQISIDFLLHVGIDAHLDSMKILFLHWWTTNRSSFNALEKAPIRTQRFFEEKKSFPYIFLELYTLCKGGEIVISTTQPMSEWRGKK